MEREGSEEDKAGGSSLTRVGAQRRVSEGSEDSGDSALQQRGTMPHVKDWDDLLTEPSQKLGIHLPAAADQGLIYQEDDVSSSNLAAKKASHETREEVLVQLGEATRKAYARGDETHPDWDKVGTLIEELRPEDIAKRRLSNVQEVSKKAEKEQIEYHFFSETLPAIRKASVVAALYAPNNFQTAGLVEKAREVYEAWENAKGKFGNLLKEQYIDPDSNNATIVGETSDFLEDSMIVAEKKEDPAVYYVQYFDYEVEHWILNCELSRIHNEVMQRIIKVGVCTRDFETKVDNKKTTEEYEKVLQEILGAKESADPVVQHKWEQFHQEAAARYLEDLSQVAKIKLWKNRNQVASINKLAERAHEQAECAATAAGAAAWQRALEEGKTASGAWIERDNQLAAARENIEAHKKTFALKIPTEIEQEIKTAITEAQQAIEHWEKQSAQVPPRIIEAAMDHTHGLYQIAMQQYELEKQLKRNGNPALARYNKEKYLKLAAEQYAKTMQLVQEVKADASRVLDVAWNDQIEQFKKEFQEKRLFLLMAPFVKSEEQVKQWEEATTKLRAAQQREEVDGVNGNAKPSEGVKAFFEAIKDYRASKHALNTTSQIPLADD